MPPKKKKQKGQKIGKIVFNEDLPHQYRAIITQLSKKINLNGFRWQLSTINGLFQKYKITQLLSYTKQININHLGLDNNKCPTIITQISVMKSFPKLQNLFLGSNNIQTIQALRYINAPILWRINLRYNFISNLKPLTKAHFPKLSMLVIGQNEISQMKDIAKCHLPTFGTIDMENNKPLNHFLHCFKIQSNDIGYFYARGSEIIQNMSYRRGFMRKWPSLRKSALQWKSYELQQESQEQQEQQFV